MDNASLGIRNYELTTGEVGLCVLTGFSAIPYGQRHWALADSRSVHPWWHVLIAFILHIPIVGGIAGMAERVVATAVRFYHLRFSSNTNHLGFVKCVTTSVSRGFRTLTDDEAQNFTNRGGLLNIISEEKIAQRRIVIDRKKPVITGCSAGLSRSQVAAGLFTNLGIQVNCVLAGASSAFNPEVENNDDMPNPLQAYECTCQSATNFQTVFGIPKRVQLGLENGTAYQQFVNELSPTHFITFGQSGAAVLRRLLERPGDLRGFTITYCPWPDEIVGPLEEGIVPHSVECYSLFRDKLQKCFMVV